MTEKESNGITEFRPRLTYRMEISLPGLPSTSNSHHSNWRVAGAERKKWRQIVKLKSGPLAPCAPLDKAKITLTRCSSRKTDFDNLVISFKSCVDGLTDAGIIADDKDSVVVQRSYLWEKVSPKKGCIKIVVEEMV